MDNSLYIALSKQMGLFRQMDVIANNIANADTSGYKAESVMFEEYLMKSGRDRLGFTHDHQTSRNLENGPLKSTGRTFDVAIEGQGYFMVQTPLGERYTRAGNFQLNADGALVTSQGYPVLGPDKQQIVFDPNDTRIRITENGSIFSDDQEIGRIGVMTFPNEKLLQKTGDTLYSSAVPAVPSDRFRVIQGAIESSNVTAVKELTKMIEIQRAVSGTSGLISDIGEMERSAVQTIAKQN